MVSMDSVLWLRVFQGVFGVLVVANMVWVVTYVFVICRAVGSCSLRRLNHLGRNLSEYRKMVRGNRRGELFYAVNRYALYACLAAFIVILALAAAGVGEGR